MNYMNILEKLRIVIDLITSSELLVITMMLLGITLFLYVNGQLSNRKLFIITLLINIVSFVVLIMSNYNHISKIVNDIINNIFMNFYFPSVEVYMFILGFMFIVLLVSTVNFKMKKSYRVINISSFFVMFYLFLNLIYIVLTKNIDIFNASSIYTNKEAVALLELSTFIYGLWMILISINFISSHIYEYILRYKTTVINSEVADSINDLRESAYVVTPNLEVEEKNNLDVLIANDGVIEEPVLNIKGNYSLNDYKTFSNILKQVIMLNRYKSQLTFNDLLDDSVLKVFPIEEQNLYVDMLNSYLK